MTGSAFDCGRSYGTQAAALIHKTIVAYERIMWAKSGLRWSDAATWASRYDECVGDLAPRSREEMRGIAEGAGIEYLDVLSLNCRSELLFIAGEGRESPAECSSFAAVQGATAHGAVFGGQNWDWNPLLSLCAVVCSVVPDDEPSYLTVAEAGHLAKVGVNSAGVAVCTNTLVSQADNGTIGLPYHVILRELLRSETVEQAVAFILSTPRAMSANFLLIDRNGTARNVESVGGQEQAVAVLDPSEGFLCHTNHFLSVSLAPGDARAASNPHTFTRLETLTIGLKEQAPVDVAALFSVLRVHEGFPHSLCSHPFDMDALEDRRATLASIVFDLLNSVVWVAIGTPCTSRYQAHEVRAGCVRRLPSLDETRLRNLPTRAISGV